MDAETAKMFAKGMIILAMVATAPAQGMIASKAMEAIGRNPGVGDSIFPKMIVAMAICESTAIFALVSFFII
jgi:F-type H+-transporting ATPase subunit c